MVFKKTIAVLVSILIMVIGLTSCSLKHESVEESNLRILEEKYGKEFVIKECFGPCDCIAYPADDPELIFYSGYTAAGGGYDLYQNEIVARRYKMLAEEKLNELGFKYKYYIDVDAYFFNEETQDDEILDYLLISNESDLDITPSNYTYILNYTLFISAESLEMTDIEIYNLATQLFNIYSMGRYGHIWLYIVTNEEYEMTLNHYSNYTEISPWGVTDFYHKIEDDFWDNNHDSNSEHDSYDARFISFHKLYNDDCENKEYKITTFEEFEQKMQEVRSNGLYK